MARALRFAVLVAGLGLGVFSLAVARGAGNSFGGDSAFAGAAELAAGYALLGVGFAALMRPRQARLGAILVAASFAWFPLEWNNPAAGSAFVFTIGLVLSAAAARTLTSTRRDWGRSSSAGSGQTGVRDRSRPLERCHPFQAQITGTDPLIVDPCWHAIL
jgi:hypothetical protein